TATTLAPIIKPDEPNFRMGATPFFPVGKPEDFPLHPPVRRRTKPRDQPSQRLEPSTRSGSPRICLLGLGRRIGWKARDEPQKRPYNSILCRASDPSPARVPRALNIS